VPLVQIGELVYPLLTVLVRLHVELCCPSAPEVRLRLCPTQTQIRCRALSHTVARCVHVCVCVCVVCGVCGVWCVVCVCV
jgi:hypothetical protein